MEKEKIKILADWLAEYFNEDAIACLSDFIGCNNKEDDFVIRKFLDMNLDKNANIDDLICQFKRLYYCEQLERLI